MFLTGQARIDNHATIYGFSTARGAHQSSMRLSPLRQTFPSSLFIVLRFFFGGGAYVVYIEYTRVYAYKRKKI